MALKERGAVTGIGETAYSRNSGKSVVALQMEASLAAIADAGLAPTDIDGIIAYANETDAHEFHLPGGGHQFFPEWQKGPFSWETPGVMNIGGYDNHVPKAKTAVDLAVS